MTPEDILNNLKFKLGNEITSGENCIEMYSNTPYGRDIIPTISGKIKAYKNVLEEIKKYEDGKFDNNIYTFNREDTNNS